MTGSTAPHELPQARIRRSRRASAAWLAILALFVAAGLSGAMGERIGSVSAAAYGYRLRVEYPEVTRSALPIRWRLVLSHDGGFDGPIRIATSIDYFELFDLNWLHPAPVEEFSSGTRTVWIYDPPEGDALVLSLDGRMEPGLTSGRSATTSVSVAGARTVSVTYTTRVWP